MRGHLTLIPETRYNYGLEVSFEFHLPNRMYPASAMLLHLGVSANEGRYTKKWRGVDLRTQSPKCLFMSMGTA